MAWQDPLTGIPNRRSFFDRADAEVRRATRYRRPLSVIVFDIDHFKAVNDSHGHDGGDEVLRRVAVLAAGLLRDADRIGRIGGEEFAVVLPETDRDGAARMAERLRVRFAETEIALADTAIAVTASFGVVAVDTGAEDAIKDAVRRADVALYEAKSQGRDRVVAAA